MMNKNSIKLVVEMRKEDDKHLTVKELADILNRMCDMGFGEHRCCYDDGACSIFSVVVTNDSKDALFRNF